MSILSYFVVVTSFIDSVYLFYRRPTASSHVGEPRFQSDPSRSRESGLRLPRKEQYHGLFVRSVSSFYLSFYLTGISRLLLGVDEERKQIHCGLVDTIGSYTFAKTLEYKAKGLSGKEGKDITVVPPHEYQERFVSALESYFMACPGVCADSNEWVFP
jgi:hypothetical protein